MDDLGGTIRLIRFEPQWLSKRRRRAVRLRDEPPQDYVHHHAHGKAEEGARYAVAHKHGDEGGDAPLNPWRRHEDHDQADDERVPETSQDVAPKGPVREARRRRVLLRPCIVEPTTNIFPVR